MTIGDGTVAYETMANTDILTPGCQPVEPTITNPNL